MSAEKTVWSLSDSDDMSANNMENTDNVRSKMMKIIDIIKAGNGLENLQTKSENIDRLQMFMSYYLINFTTSIY